MTTDRIDYEFLKQASDKLRKMGYKASVKELIALAPGNDPFYTGAPSQVRDAEWFAEVYQQLGITSSSVHLRRVHYRILDLPESVRTLPVPMTTKDKETGKIIEFATYENHDRCWEWLTGAAKYARYLGLVPIDSFVDNRAKEASFSFYANWPKPGDWGYNDPTPSYEVSGGQWYDYNYRLPDLPELDDLPEELDDLPHFWVKGYDEVQQRYHIEIWVEKSEAEDVILPLCQRYKVNFVPGIGDMSITTTYRFCERVKQSGKPARLLYISDFDPSGKNMPVAVARKLEHMVYACGFGDLDITLEPVLLTEAQVIKYNLPPMPVKESDARKDKWESAYGGAVELNAMFARDERITEARRIIESAILQYYDPGLQRRAIGKKQALDESLTDERESVLEIYTDEWQAIKDDYQGLTEDWQELREEFDRLVSPFARRIESYRSRLDEINRRCEDIFSRVTDDLEQVDIDLEREEYSLPEANEANTDHALYFSKRGYWQQLADYYTYRLQDGDSLPDWLEAVSRE